MFPSCVVALLLVAVIIKDVGVVSAAVWQGGSTGVEAVWGWCKNKRAKVLRLMSAEAEDFQSEMTSFFSPLISCTTFKPTTWTVTPARTQLLQKWRLSEFSCQRAGWPKISTIFLPFFHHQWRVGLSDVHPWRCWLLKQMENRPRIHSKNWQIKLPTDKYLQPGVGHALEDRLAFSPTFKNEESASQTQCFVWVL